MEVPTIRTARLRLRPWRAEDAAPLHGILAEEGVLRYFPNPVAPPLERVERFVTRQQDHWQEHGYGWWAVEAWDEGRLIGWNGLQYLPETDEVEVGYLLDRPYWGQGLAAEGAREGLRWGFEAARLPAIIAVAHPDNRASQRVMEKVGMRFVPALPAPVPQAQVGRRPGEETVYFGMAVRRYRITAEEWAAQNGGADGLARPG